MDINEVNNDFHGFGVAGRPRQSPDDSRAEVFLVSRRDAGTPRRAELLLGKRTEEGNTNFKIEVRDDPRSDSYPL